MKRPTSIVLVLCAAALASRAFAKEIEGVRFADQIRAGGAVMRLNAVGLMRYRYVIKAYVAALYLGDGARANEVLADAPKRLEIEYFYAIKASGFANATNEGIVANVPPDVVTKLRSRIDELNAEISRYPGPIARCDAQLGGLLEERARLVRLAEALREFETSPEPFREPA